MQLGRLEEASEALARASAAGGSTARLRGRAGLDSLAALGRLEGKPTRAVERERDEIFGRLGVVATPEIPLPLDDG